MVAFEKKLTTHGRFPLHSDRVDTLQVNMGKLCNQSCKHCHVEAGPNRTEVMSRETVDGVLCALRHDAISSIDITGGAPEMNPHFEHLVERASSLGKRITVRSQSGDPTTCVIDCEGQLSDRGGGARRGFYFHSGETAASVVSGVTITNGLTTPT